MEHCWSDNGSKMKHCFWMYKCISLSIVHGKKTQNEEKCVTKINYSHSNQYSKALTLLKKEKKELLNNIINKDNRNKQSPFNGVVKNKSWMMREQHFHLWLYYKGVERNVWRTTLQIFSKSDHLGCSRLAVYMYCVIKPSCRQVAFCFFMNSQELPIKEFTFWNHTTINW